MSKPRKYARALDPAEAARLESQATSMAATLAREFKLLNLGSNMKVLDAGCGSGVITRRIAEAVHPETVVGMDIDPVFIEEARKTSANKGIENIRFDIGNIDGMDYEAGSFDLAYCRLVLMHVNDPVRAVSEMRRVTRKGGYVAASDLDDDLIAMYPEAPTFWRLWEKYGERAARSGQNRRIGKELYSIFYRAGLRSISVHPMPIFATAANPEAYKIIASVPLGILESSKSDLIDEGLASDEDFKKLHEEFDRLSKDKGAFGMFCTFLAIGKVP